MANAHMIPSRPKECDPKSEEWIVFNALKDLGEDYYVFHDFSVTAVSNGTVYEREIDFVVAHREKGILCIEAKNGAGIYYDNREWKYQSGKNMEKGGPYKQVASAKRTLINKIESCKDPVVCKLVDKCKVNHAVWFFRMTKEHFDTLQGIAEDADPSLTLLADDLINPSDAISRIMSYKIPKDNYSKIDHVLTEKEFSHLLNSVLCPVFHIVSDLGAKNIAITENMNQLLREQYKLLDFLEEQNTAIINGAAGTGKTMIAVEKARRHSANGEKVLFLCYNRLLCSHLQEKYQKNKSSSQIQQFNNVDFMTISELAKNITGNYEDLIGLYEWLCNCESNTDTFPYKHVIVDEGQDFGLVDDAINNSDVNAETNCSIIDTIQEVVLKKGGTFYLFYDKYQTIEGKNSSKESDKKAEENYLPECITDCECKMTLHKNCRNTEEIATTSVTPIKDKKGNRVKSAVALSNWLEPEKPVMHIIREEEDTRETLDRILESYKRKEINDIVILTSERIDYSAITEYLDNDLLKKTGYYTYTYNGQKYRVTTCKKYKGLEADAIVYIDLNRDSFSGKKGLEFYVGTSRARIKLDLICCLNSEDYNPIISAIDPNAPAKSNLTSKQNILSKVLSVVIQNE